MADHRATRRITSFGGVPTIMWRILESPNLEKYDLSSVQRASYGGAPAAPELVERIEEVFPNLRKTLATAYGLTETASVATAIGGEDYFAHPGFGRAARAHGRGAHRRRTTASTPTRASAARCGSRART